jgi:hypothetical protein
MKEQYCNYPLDEGKLPVASVRLDNYGYIHDCDYIHYVPSRRHLIPAF